ncbi:hypothetical protein [Roseovarius indicus]|uniref:Uncharacterized protein n=1 Tax=Roseovarius indicus TaxID=540747 RepID=A0A0T5NX66_9RHOB|nr:hypothetical protein [Roseovarius indicus]KRS13409.1 hypothetical protein XM52_27620 [Roseovarius indicus]QEW29877.1 hypothetical protein RIdsm_05723 [Roseovarius indicus]SFE70514.1 hypothetical protein SAMN04488031_11711 [Roseovarius indicus]
MDDKHMGGLLAFVIAAPIMVICCGGGGLILAAILGGIGGWLTGLGGIAAVVTAIGAALVVREIRRSGSAGVGDAPDETSTKTKATAQNIHRPADVAAE